MIFQKCILLDKIRKQYPALPHFVGPLQTSPTVVDCEEITGEGIDDEQGNLYMATFISLICIAFPQSSLPGFRDRE